MGSSWSSKNECGRPKWWFSSGDVTSSDCSPKRQRRMIEHQWELLIPGLPDEVAMQVLARVSRSWHPVMKMVNSSWNRAMNGRDIYDLRQELGVTEQWLYVLMKDKEDELVWFSLEPGTGKWRRLPLMPKAASEPDSESDWSLWIASRYAFAALMDALRGKKSSGERIPFFGCSAAEVDGCLYVLGGFLREAATPSVFKYDPRRNTWSAVASMGTARAYCKIGLLEGKLYAVGGVNRSRNGLLSLQSAEVYDPLIDTWSAIPSMSFFGAHILPAPFMTEILKPIATGMATFQGKLCVPQSLYSWPFFMDIGGEVYDPAGMNWSAMPKGMGDGWPAREAGMKLSVVVNGNLYSLDPRASICDGGSKLKMYDPELDVWRVVRKRVPVLLDAVADSETPYLLGCLEGRLLLVIKDDRNNVAIVRTALDGQPDECEWTEVAAANFGRVELVACQVLEI